MPTNPLLAFFKKSNEELKLTPPVAFGITGDSFDPTTVTNDALLIILDDRHDEIPILKHSNCDKNSPLRIIWHNETDEKKNGLVLYGKPTKVTGFSHVPSNTIYKSLLAILQKNGNVQGFVNQWQNVADLAVFDELAAVIQLLPLLEKDTKEEIYTLQRYEVLRECCPSDLNKSVETLCKDRQYLKAVQAIEAHVSTMLNNKNP
ncbi:MAG: hypothetical protein ABL863_12800 [Nitrosomonas sp.]